MGIDESVERVIPLPCDQVAAYAMDWRHDAEWTQGIRTARHDAEWTQGIRTAQLTREADTGGFGVGAEVTRTAYFLGKRIDYVLRVAAYEPARLLDMVSVAGPLPMHVTYTFEHLQDGGTRARIRVRGDASGLYRLAGPMMGRKVRSSLVKDLQDLERQVSRRTRG